MVRVQGFLPTQEFATEYGDHFNTSSVALRDVAPLLHKLAEAIGKPSATLAVYDPYYCDGSVKARFAELGFGAVVNRNSDFYRDARERLIPPFEAIVTNPPYSADHKERALEYCASCGKPWCILLPSWCTTKKWFVDLTRGTGAFFLVPSTRYTYDHPEGTGHEESPFFSVWIAGGFGSLDPTRVQLANGAKLARTVPEMEGLGAVRTTKRLSGKRRKKIRKQQEKRVAAAAAAEVAAAAAAGVGEQQQLPLPSQQEPPALSAKERRRRRSSGPRKGAGAKQGAKAKKPKKKKRKREGRESGSAAKGAQAKKPKKKMVGAGSGAGHA